MKKMFICMLAALAIISACKKNSTASLNCVSDFSGCYIDNYQYTYSSGNTDTTIMTYWATDSFSYTTHSSGTNYIYCYKYKGDSISVRRYTNTLSNLTYYGTVQLNGQHLSASDLFHSSSGFNSSGSSTYNSDGTPAEQLSDYGTYSYHYFNTYDGNGNKKYSIIIGSGISLGTDSFVYVYDLAHTSKIAYGYPNAKLYGAPDKNLVTQIRRYDAPTDTLKSTSDYTYLLDGCGIVTQKNTTTTYTGSGTVYHYVEKFMLNCK
jgi:hypothetical protein